MTNDRRPNESLRAYLLRKEPNLPVIEKAIEEFKAGKPVTQRSVDTGEPLVVEESKRLGFLLVRAGRRVLYRVKLAKEKDAIATMRKSGYAHCYQTPFFLGPQTVYDYKRLQTNLIRRTENERRRVYCPLGPGEAQAA